jgi:glycerol-3-phosphate dehydrogenase (NAD(P)+)
MFLIKFSNLQPLHSLTVIGGGSWATALVKIFSESCINVKWYLRSQEHVNFLQTEGRNPNYLSFLQLNLQYIQPTCIIDEAIASSTDILFAVPSAFLETTIAELGDDILRDKRVYVSIKGLVSEQLLIELGRKFSCSCGEQCHERNKKIFT